MIGLFDDFFWMKEAAAHWSELSRVGRLTLTQAFVSRKRQQSRDKLCTAFLAVIAGVIVIS